LAQANKFNHKQRGENNMEKAREVFDELIKNENKFSNMEVEYIWDIFNEAEGEDIEVYMNQYFTDALTLFDDKTLIEGMNKIFDVCRDSCHLFLTVEDYCNWVIGECNKWKSGFTPYNLNEIIMNIHDNFDDDDIFDDGTFIFQQTENGDYDPCNIMPVDRCDIESILFEYLSENGDDAMDVVSGYCDDDKMKLWCDHWDVIAPLYEEWQSRLEEMEEEEDE